MGYGAGSTGRGAVLAVEGEAELVEEQSELNSVADTFEAKYGAEFLEPDGTWFGLGRRMRDGETQLYRVTPSKIFGWEKGKTFGETRWRFPS